MTFQRALYSTIQQQVDTDEIIVLTGMRRVGKTTLYRSLFDSISSHNKIFLDAENPLDQKIFEELDYNNIWHNLTQLGLSAGSQAYVFIDEIQAVPEIVKPIKYLYDHYHLKFFLTGSSSYYLKNLFPESLAGRKIIFELFPLTFSEFLNFRGLSLPSHSAKFSELARDKSLFAHTQAISLYKEYLQYGGFPGVVTQPDINQKKLILRDIFQSYYEKDVRGLSSFRDLGRVRDLILLLTQRVGSKLDITKLAGELGSTRDSLYSYLSFLEATYFISTISPFSRNLDRELSGGRKVYFCDTGLLNILGQVSEGCILENSVYNNLRPFGQLNYYQKRGSAKEIDFILNQKIALEVKSQATTHYLHDLQVLAASLKLPEHYLLSLEYVDLDNVIPITSLT